MEFYKAKRPTTHRTHTNIGNTTRMYIDFLKKKGEYINLMQPIDIWIKIMLLNFHPTPYIIKQCIIDAFVGKLMKADDKVLCSRDHGDNSLVDYVLGVCLMASLSI